MGKRNRSRIVFPSLFFVTTALREWKPLFSAPKLLDSVEGILFTMFPDYANALMGHVLMPSHIHFMVGCRGGGPQLSKMVGTFKSLSVRQLFPGHGSVWMHRFDDLVINTEKQLWIKLNYIHQNPVCKGLVVKAVDWKWSSARFWLLNENHPILTKSWEWLSGGDA